MTPLQIEHYFNDIDLLQKLNHPNILALNEFYEDPHRFYMVTELCTGDELFDQISFKLQNGETFSEKEAAKIIV